MKYTIDDFKEELDRTDIINDILDTFRHISVKSFYTVLMHLCEEAEMKDNPLFCKLRENYRQQYAYVKKQMPYIESMVLGELLEHAAAIGFYDEESTYDIEADVKEEHWFYQHVRICDADDIHMDDLDIDDIHIEDIDENTGMKIDPDLGIRILRFVLIDGLTLYRLSTYQRPKQRSGREHGEEGH